MLIGLAVNVIGISLSLSAQGRDAEEKEIKESQIFQHKISFALGPK
jgi:hypothetical protein